MKSSEWKLVWKMTTKKSSKTAQNRNYKLWIKLPKMLHFNLMVVHGAPWISINGHQWQWTFCLGTNRNRILETNKFWILAWTVPVVWSTKTYSAHTSILNANYMCSYSACPIASSHQVTWCIVAIVYSRVTHHKPDIPWWPFWFICYNNSYFVSQYFFGSRPNQVKRL